MHDEKQSNSTLYTEVLVNKQIQWSAVVFAIILPISLNAWSFAGLTSLVSRACSFMGEKLNSLIEERPLAAAGIGLFAATFCSVAIYLKKFQKKPDFAHFSDEYPSEYESDDDTDDCSSGASDYEDYDSDAYSSDGYDSQQEDSLSDSSLSTSDDESNDSDLTIEKHTHDVLLQHGNTCGFHALYNVLCLANMAVNNKKKIDYIREYDNQIKQIQDWQELVEKDADLTIEDIQLLIRNSGAIEKYGVDAPIFVLSDIEQMLDNMETLTDSYNNRFINALKDLKEGRSEKPVCFIIGNMKQTESHGRIGTKYGHYAAAVVHKNARTNTLHIEFANSMPSYSMKESLSKLEQLLRTPIERLEIKREVIPFAKLLDDTVKRNASEDQISSNLIDLHMKVQNVSKHNYNHLYKELKPMRGLVRTLNAKIIPQIKDEQAIYAWEEMKQNPAVKRLLNSQNKK